MQRSLCDHLEQLLEQYRGRSGSFGARGYSDTVLKLVIRKIRSRTRHDDLYTRKSVTAKTISARCLRRLAHSKALNTICQSNDLLMCRVFVSGSDIPYSCLCNIVIPDPSATSHHKKLLCGLTICEGAPKGVRGQCDGNKSQLYIQAKGFET